MSFKEKSLKFSTNFPSISIRYGPDISCEPRSCGQPADPAHGWHAGECYTYGCRITYHCGDGYELVGKQAADCQADGTWSPKELPVCVCKYCEVTSDTNSTLPV